MTKRILIALALISLMTACQKMRSNNSRLKNFGPEVIYGQDNRKDFFEITDPHWKALGQSTVALISYRDLQQSEDGLSFEISSRHYGYRFHLCEDEPFFSQPSASFCSGFLIGPDLVVTAGHCLRNKYNCQDVRFVFGYQYNEIGSTPLSVPADQVYKCSELLHSETNALNGSDFAIARLDRKVTTYSPLLLRTEGKLSQEDELTVIGYPSGLPGKFADQGLVRDIEKEKYVVASLDTYGGNSGSAVFNSNTRLVEGILVNGDTDFNYDKEDKCRRSNVCKQEDCRGEDVVRIDVIFEHISPSDL